MLSTRERSSDDRFVLLDLVQGIGLRTLDGATRLFELNLRATRALVDETTGRLRAAFDPQARGGLPVAPPMPDLERATSYGRDVYRIVAGTNAEIVELMQRHVRSGWTEGATRLGSAQADVQRAAQHAAAVLARAGEQVLSQQEPVAPVPSAVSASPSEQAAPNETPEAPSAAGAAPPAATAAPASVVASNVATPASAADVTAEPTTLAEVSATTVFKAAAAPAVSEAPRRPRATRIGRAASRKSAPNAS